MRARVAHPADALDGADGPQQLVEQRPHALVAARLAGGEREVASVAVDVLAEQRHLGDAVGRGPAHLVDDVVEADG